MVDPLTEPFAGLCSALRGMRDQVQALVHVHESIDAFNVAFGDFHNAMALHASCLTFPKAPPQKKVSIQLSGIPPPQTSGLALVRRASRESADSNGSLNGASGSGSGASVTGKNRNSSVGGGKGKKSLSMGGRNSGGGSGGISNNTQQQQQRAQVKPGHQQQQQKKRKAPPAAKKPEPPAWKWDKHIRDQIPRKYQSKEELKKLENILLYIKNRQSGITIADLVKHSGLAVIKSKEILQTLMKLELIHRDHEKSGFVYTFGSAH